jgi:hypothetical protein
MISIAAVMVCLAEDDAAEALATLAFADEIHIFVEVPAMARCVDGEGRHVHVIDRPACIEAIGDRLIEASKADWTLLLDPDERVRADGRLLREALGEAAVDVAAYDVVYELHLFGAELATTFGGLRKTKLVRSGRCRWPSDIHALPRPIYPLDRVAPLDATAIAVVSELADDLPRRLQRHSRWAEIEANSRDGRAVDVDRLLEAFEVPLVEYLEHRNGAADDTGGVANALLHVAKEIQRVMFEASKHGLVPMDRGDHRRIEQLLDAARLR